MARPIEEVWVALRSVLHPGVAHAVVLATVLSGLPAWGSDVSDKNFAGESGVALDGVLPTPLKPDQAKVNAAWELARSLPPPAWENSAAQQEKIPALESMAICPESDLLEEVMESNGAAVEAREAAIAVTSLAVKPHLLAYRAGQITTVTATETWEDWLASQNLDSLPPASFELVGALPADSSRADLYRTLLTQQPDDLWLQWRTIQLVAQTAPDQAQLESLIVANPDDITVYFFQGELAQQQGNLPLAADAYRQVLAREPENLGALSALAGVEFQQGNLPAARTLYNQVLALDPDYGEARYAIAELNITDGQKLSALEQLQQIPPEAVVPANLEQRVQDVEFEQLRRRGFQPSWERH